MLSTESKQSRRKKLMLDIFPLSVAFSYTDQFNAFFTFRNFMRFLSLNIVILSRSTRGDEVGILIWSCRICGLNGALETLSNRSGFSFREVR